MNPPSNLTKVLPTAVCLHQLEYAKERPHYFKWLSVWSIVVGIKHGCCSLTNTSPPFCLCRSRRKVIKKDETGCILKRFGLAIPMKKRKQGDLNCKVRGIILVEENVPFLKILFFLSYPIYGYKRGFWVQNLMSYTTLTEKASNLIFRLYNAIHCTSAPNHTSELGNFHPANF